MGINSALSVADQMRVGGIDQRGATFALVTLNTHTNFFGPEAVMRTEKTCPKTGGTRTASAADSGTPNSWQKGVLQGVFQPTAADAKSTCLDGEKWQKGAFQGCAHESHS